MKNKLNMKNKINKCRNHFVKKTNNKKSALKSLKKKIRNGLLGFYPPIFCQMRQGF